MDDLIRVMYSTFVNQTKMMTTIIDSTTKNIRMLDSQISIYESWENRGDIPQDIKSYIVEMIPLHKKLRQDKLKELSAASEQLTSINTLLIALREML